MADFIRVTVPLVVISLLSYLIWKLLRPWRVPRSAEVAQVAELFTDPRWLPSGWAAATFACAYALVFSVRRFAPIPEAIGAGLLVVPILALVWFVIAFVRDVRTGDEFARRIQADALSFAFISFMCGGLAVSLMDQLGPSPPDRPFDPALMFLPLNYFFGLFVAKGRYLPTTEDLA